ncbi:phosphate ABC transporter substrate-binding protein PstS family protein [Bacillus lacus]|uniref:Phosphate-binding protein n=1 Tax=Metabacillus lacus TaxID=1983721 RepID=A0A7X2J0T0_9BACI|nr:PstS family phosphate ABC transporter substrate-binding protein [Metabacillus lacus]MRX72643.1 phosphate ABC transporter substrate-binding protein PstS family protein [Metabacillus lacus]
MKSFKFLALSIMISSVLAFAAACGNGDDSGSTPEQQNTEQAEENGNTEGEGEGSDDLAQLEGEVGIDGSSTVGPIMEAVSEEFGAAAPNVKAPIGISGTGGGFKRFVVGETDMSNASREIKDEEAQQAEENGIEYTELEVAFDGISVVVNQENDWIEQLTIDELKTMWIEDGTATKWSDVNPEWPEEEISFYSPGTDSGTYDYFNEVVLEDEPVAKAATLSEDDNVLVKGVQGDKNAIGFFGYSYYLENKDSLKVVPIVNEAGEAVEPTAESIESGDYNPLSRPLYVYVNNASVKDKEQVYQYLKFMLENAGDLAEEVGYVRLPEDKYNEGMETIEGLR